MFFNFVEVKTVACRDRGRSQADTATVLWRWPSTYGDTAENSEAGGGIAHKVVSESLSMTTCSQQRHQTRLVREQKKGRVCKRLPPPSVSGHSYFSSFIFPRLRYMSLPFPLP